MWGEHQDSLHCLQSSWGKHDAAQVPTLTDIAEDVGANLVALYGQTTAETRRRAEGAMTLHDIVDASYLLQRVNVLCVVPS